MPSGDKLVIDPTSERILGVGICGPSAGEMISEGVLAIEMGSDESGTSHPSSSYAVGNNHGGRRNVLWRQHRYL
jgi:pyruvate/2-oxoglutarate dehydrogenase complex dihydrolipoamide dehydrogenase (E3) component